MTPQDDSSPRIGHIEKRCFDCRYDLSGSDSPVCPECGTPRLLRLDFAARDQFKLAQTALGKDDLLRRVLASAGTVEIASVLTGREPTGGAVWIDVSARAEAMRALQEAGVHQLGLVLPIVDRADPVCPKCDRAVEPDGPSRCPHCGAAFEWVSIEDPDVSVVDRTCRACGYELLGLKSDRCPECGTLLPVDLDAMVEAALALEGDGDEEREREADAVAPDRTRSLNRLAIVVLVIVVAVIVGAMSLGALVWSWSW